MYVDMLFRIKPVGSRDTLSDYFCFSFLFDVCSIFSKIAIWSIDWLGIVATGHSQLYRAREEC